MMNNSGWINFVNTSDLFSSVRFVFLADILVDVLLLLLLFFLIHSYFTRVDTSPFAKYSTRFWAFSYFFIANLNILVLILTGLLYILWSLILSMSASKIFLGEVSTLLIADFIVDYIMLVILFTLIFYSGLKFSSVTSEKTTALVFSLAFIIFFYFGAGLYIFSVILLNDTILVLLGLLLCLALSFMVTEYLTQLITLMLLSLIITLGWLTWTSDTFFVLCPEVLLFAYFLLLYVSLICKTDSILSDAFVRRLSVEVLLSVVIVSYCIYSLMCEPDLNTMFNKVAFSSLFRYTKPVLIIQLVFGCFVTLFFITVRVAFRDMPTFQQDHRQYTLLIISFILVGFLLIKSDNALLFWLLIEALTLISYGFIAIGSSFNMRDVLTYFIFNSFAGCLILFGILIVSWDPSIGCIPSLHSIPPVLSTAVNSLLIKSGGSNLSLVFYFGILTAIGGFLIKLGIAPLHLWVIKIYPGLRFDVFFFFLILNKLILLIGLLKIFSYILLIGAVTEVLRVAVALFGTVSALIGCTLAWGDSDFRRFFTVASMVQMSLIFFTLSCLTKEALVTTFIYSICYFLFLVGFYCVCSSYLLLPSLSKDVFTGFSLRVIFSDNWFRGLLFITFLFAFIGLPPFLLFFVKLHLFVTIYTSYYFWLFLFLLCVNGATGGYYLFLLISSVVEPDKKVNILVFNGGMHGLLTPDSTQGLKTPVIDPSLLHIQNFLGCWRASESVWQNTYNFLSKFFLLSSVRIWFLIFMSNSTLLVTFYWYMHYAELCAILTGTW